MKYLILFDIDGTLIRMKKGFSNPIFFNVIRDILGFEIDRSIKIDFAGRTDYGILTHIFKSAGLESSHFEENLNKIYSAIYEEFRKEMSNDSMKVLDGVPELLQMLSMDRRIELGLVTGNFEKNALLKLEYCGLDKFFTCGAFGDRLPNRLDLPKLALKNAKMYDDSAYSSINTLVVGDTHRDVQSAQHNKMKSMAVATGGSTYTELLKFKPDLLLENLEDFRNVYESILKLFGQK